MSDNERKKEIDALYKRFGMINEEEKDFDPTDPILEQLEKKLFLLCLIKKTINGKYKRIK